MMTRLVLVIAMLAACAGQVGTVTTEHDRFSGSTTAKLEGMTVTAGGEFLALSFAAQDGVLSVSLLRMGSGWRYLKCHRLDWLIDGEPARIPHTRHDGSVMPTGDVQELVYGAFPQDAAKRMAEALTVEGRLCRDEFKLTTAQVEQVLEFAHAAGLWRPTRAPQREDASPAPKLRPAPPAPEPEPVRERGPVVDQSTDSEDP